MNEAAFPYVAEQLVNYPTRRAALLRAIAKAPYKPDISRLRPTVLGLLVSPSAELREAAVLAVPGACGQTLESWLILHLMLFDPDPHVHGQAINGLFQHKWGVPWHWRQHVLHRALAGPALN